jgi:methyltransferase FkbM-like protein
MRFLLLKRLIPDTPRPLPILRGPFRGARVIASPRHSLRQMFGLYEHELNNWIGQVLPRVNKVLDIGANDGYFTFGCAAAFRRLNKRGEIYAFEPESDALSHLEQGIDSQSKASPNIHAHKFFVSDSDSETTITLDTFAKLKPLAFVQNALIKIDVEGAELDVIAGASAWLNPTNYFLIEVHWDETYLSKLRDTFKQRGLSLRQVNQQPLPLIGREVRGENQWWLVSSLL